MIIKEHFMRWGETYFSEKLINAGFVSYKDENLSWYKVVNNEVLLSVYIYGSFSLASVGMVGYGIHPLFVEAPIPQKVHVSGWVNGEIMIQLPLQPPSSWIDGQTRVMCPTTPKRGAECLDHTIFPLFSTIHDIEDCYAFHKQRWMQLEQERIYRGSDVSRMLFATNDFIDMAIYVDDKEMYPRCLKDLKLHENWHNRKEQARMPLMRAAIECGQREDYLKVLENRKLKFTRKLEKKLGISV